MNEKISRVLDIPIEITAILGRTKMSLNEILELGRGSLIELDTLENQEVEILDLPEKLEISQLLLEEEQVQTNNIVYQRGKPRGGGAFHAKKAKNTYTAEDNRRNVMKKRMAKKKKK